MLFNALMEASFSQVMAQKKYMCWYPNIWPMSYSVQRESKLLCKRSEVWMSKLKNSRYTFI